MIGFSSLRLNTNWVSPLWMCFESRIFWDLAKKSATMCNRYNMIQYRAASIIRMHASCSAQLILAKHRQIFGASMFNFECVQCSAKPPKIGCEKKNNLYSSNQVQGAYLNRRNMLAPLLVSKSLWILHSTCWSLTFKHTDGITYLQREQRFTITNPVGPKCSLWPILHLPKDWSLAVYCTTFPQMAKD